jgi:hypothetical protein
MVGKRPWTSGSGNANGHDKNASKNGSIKKQPIGLRFQDVSNKILEDQRREDIKNLLIDGMDRDVLERYRKTPDEVRRHHPFQVLDY